MVQMCLTWLCHFLNLERVTQVSLVEYNSKRNFMERVHPQVNKALSAHDAFSSHAIHSNVRGPRKPKLIENIEKMVEDVIDCLKWVKFGGKFIKVYWGLKEDDWIFNDEAEVKKFLSLSKLSKETSGMSYQARKTPLAQSLYGIRGNTPGIHRRILERLHSGKRWRWWRQVIMVWQIHISHFS